MTPAELARVDQCRADAAGALERRRDCGECIPDETLRRLLALTDESLLALIQAADQ